LTPAVIRFKQRRVRSAHVTVAAKITIAWVCIITGHVESAPPEIRLEGGGIEAIHILIIIEIARTLTGAGQKAYV
jgi:hypothetical protein